MDMLGHPGLKTLHPEQIKYEKIWGWDRYVAARYRVRARWWDAIAEHAGDAQTFVDLGCGNGYTAEHFGATGVDIATNALQADIPFIHRPIWESFDERWDFAICTDVLEHVPEDLVDRAIDTVRTVAERAFVVVDLDKEGLNLGDPLHLTIRPKEWWEDKMDAPATMERDAAVFRL